MGEVDLIVLSADDLEYPENWLFRGGRAEASGLDVQGRGAVRSIVGPPSDS